MANDLDPQRPAESVPRKSASPLLWLLVLVVALVLIWFAYTRFASQSTPAPTQPASTGNVPIGGSETSQREAAAQAERDQADAAAQRQQQP